MSLPQWRWKEPDLFRRRALRFKPGCTRRLKPGHVSEGARGRVDTKLPHGKGERSWPLCRGVTTLVSTSMDVERERRAG